MNKMRLAALAAMLAICVNAQQPTQPQRRDLSVKDVPDAPKSPRSVAPPRSYALIVGVAKYQNLSEKQNLLYSERDAESLYSILISPEGVVLWKGSNSDLSG